MSDTVDPFRGAAALVTGAGSGIGRALTLALVERGAFVHAADLDERAVADLAAAHPAVTAVALDVTDGDAVGRALEGVVAAHGVLDLLFNNAGVFAAGRTEEMSEDAWRRLIDVNLWGVIHGTRHGYRRMLAQGHGHIVNTSSTAGLLPTARMTAYAATKHAVIGLSTSLRAEAARHDVRVSVAVPGVVDTGIIDSAIDIGDRGDPARLGRAPLRPLTSAQAARAILRGVEHNDAMIVFPRYNRALARLHGLAPGLATRLVNSR